jgi:hypothetical protein
MILVNTRETLMKTLISLFISVDLNNKSMKTLKTCQISWNVASTNASHPKSLLILKPFALTLVGCPLSASKRQHRPLLSLHGLHLVVLFANTAAPGGLPLMLLTDGMKTSLLMLSSQMLLCLQ